MSLKRDAGMYSMHTFVIFLPYPTSLSFAMAWGDKVTDADSRSCLISGDCFEDCAVAAKGDID